MLPSLLNLTNTPRGLRIPHGGRNDEQSAEHAFKEARKFRLTASMLPTWMDLAKRRTTREDVIQIMNAHSGVYELINKRHFQQALDYGRVHEERALIGYHELTRFMVGLGSLRFADDKTVLMEKGETMRQVDVKQDVRWDSILSATPDGFVADGSDEHHLTFGLIEIKCPAAKDTRNAVNVMPDQLINGKKEMYALFLQVWEQLEVVQQAQYCDLVVYKKTDTVPVDEYLWIARLYRDETMMLELKKLLKPHFQSFAEAVEAMREDAQLTETDEESFERAKIAFHQKKLRVRDGKGGEFTPAILKRERDCEKTDVTRLLEAWFTSSLHFRDAGSADFPWKTDEQLNMVGVDPTKRLIRRYHVQTGECATFYQGTHSPATFQRRTVTADQLWTRELMA